MTELDTLSANRSDKTKDKKLTKKAQKKVKSVTCIRGIKSLPQKIETMRQTVEQYLGNKRDMFICIRHPLELFQYANDCIDYGTCAIDTETTSLDVMTCKLVGFSMKTGNKKACYVPVNHVDYMTEERLPNQVTEEQVGRALQLMKEHKVQFIFFNADFDVRVFRHTVIVDLPVYFDCYIAARLLNENEPDNGLKALYKKYVLDGKEDTFAFTQLFEKIPFDLVPIEVAALYGANDAYVTYELFLFQLPFLMSGWEECVEQELEGVQYVFWNIEMPIVPIIADMEDRGVAFDFDYQSELSAKYNAMLKEAEDKYYSHLVKYTPNWYSISSSKQLCELFYDDLKVLKPAFDKKAGKERRTVDAETLSSLDHELAKDILEYRACQKLISTYIDKMAVVAKNDGRVHCRFNQVGTDTGRFSSSDPNLQNIPSNNHDIRKMFKATDGYVFVGGDLSAQEVRMVANLCGDSKMIQAYKDGKDLYCEIASMAFNVPYDDCKEFYPDGTTNKDGKARRSAAKKIVLGINYGKGIKAIAEDLNVSIDKAKEIYAAVMYAFPDLERYEKESKQMAKDCGYVTTLFGRKRRLPDIQLPKYEMHYRNGNNLTKFAYVQLCNKLDRLWFEDRKKYIAELAKDGIIVKDNGGLIARAERQCVNARVQGSSGEQIKIILFNLAHDEELNKLNFFPLLTIHDEIIGECPIENAKEVAERFRYIMEHSMDEYMSVPSKTDITITKCWYGEEVNV